jgi:type IV pilus assembly protein PilQ
MTCLSKRPKVLAAMLGAATLAAWSIPAVAETVRVRNIRVSEAAGDTSVVIAASARPTFTTWKLEQPARVVIELSGARLGDVNVPMDAGTYAVGLVSASVTEDESAGPRTRIVLTLRQASDYRVDAKGNDITLRVVPHVRPAVASAGNAEAKTQAEAKAKAEAEAKAQAEAKARAELKAQAEGRARMEAQSRAEQQTRVAAQAKAEAAANAEARRQTEAKLRDEAQQRAAAEAKAEERARAEAAARLETERLRTQLAEAQRETARARAEASAAARESQRQKVALEDAEARARAEASVAAKENQRQKLALEQAEARARAEALAAAQESQRQRLALEQADTRVRQAQAEAEEARRRAEAAESETAVARARELDRDKALRAAALEVDARQKALDRIAQQQHDQQSQLEKAARLVNEREVAARASEANLAQLDREARAARARQESLSRDASAKSRAEAAAAAVEAERQRAQAAKITEQSRLELAQAVSSRQQEEGRKEEQAQLRRAEETKLAAAVASRKDEERRLADAQAERIRLEADRARLEKERARLESARQALLAELQRAKTAAAPPFPTRQAVAPPASAAASPVPAQTIVAGRKGAGAVPAIGRPRSITLRAPSQVRAIDFVDEPSRSSVIIDVDERTTVSVERMGGRRLSLRLEHSELPEGLERNLDATEYLGPVKTISSYRDRSLRGTVRVDVNLAEDVPNRVRVQGNRIYWDFEKAQGQAAPSLPAVLFVPAQRVAGFVATAKDGLWVAQAAPPYLSPPSGGGAGNPGASGTPAPSTPAPASAGEKESRRGASGAGGGRGPLGKKRYVGRRIDLDFKGADIHNILRLLADVGQVNVIVADDVRGEVTIKMRDVPWDQALDVILRSKGLGSVREGNLLRVAPLPQLEKELEAEIARRKQIEDVLPTETRLIGVSYAEAGALQDRAKDLLTPRGKISVDQRTNTLIVSDVVKSLQLVEDLVRNLDTQTSQVVIEARIVEANSNFARQIGVQWGGSGFMDTTHGNPTGLVFPYNVGIGGGTDDAQAPLGGLVPAPRAGDGLNAASPNFLVNMPAPAGMGTGAAIGLTMGSVASAFNMNLRLSAYESTGSVRILSSPRITTMDNIEASISQGVSIPVSTVSAMGAQTQFVDAKLSLSVKPHVTNEGTIALVISVTRNEPDFVNTGARGDPTIQKKEARTTMLVRDGDTAVIGGVYTRNTGLSSNRIPYFSDIPVLGWFFRSKKENDNRSEFLVFITPRIVNRARTAAQ